MLCFSSTTLADRCKSLFGQFFNILDYDTVPVVLSGTDMTAVAPPHSYINIQDFPSIEGLAAHLRQLHNACT